MKSMFLFYFSIVLAILSTLLYQLSQKLTPANANPILAITTTYLSAFLLCLAILILFPPKDSLPAAFRQLSWTTFALAAAITGIEFGFLLAYRAGWNISILALMVNAAGTVLLVPVGLLLFREKLSAINVIGICLCILGLIMINWRR